MRLKPRFEGGDGRLDVEARLRNLDGRRWKARVELVVPVAQGRDALRLKRDVRLAGGVGPDADDAPRVSRRTALGPVAFGEQPIYRAELVTRDSTGTESARVDDTFAFRELTWDIGARRWAMSSMVGRSSLRALATARPTARRADPERFDADSPQRRRPTSTHCAWSPTCCLTSSTGERIPRECSCCRTCADRHLRLSRQR